MGFANHYYESVPLEESTVYVTQQSNGESPKHQERMRYIVKHDIKETYPIAELTSLLLGNFVAEK